MTRTLGRGRLHVDIVDYPGEWLLDLPLLSKDFATWSGGGAGRGPRAGTGRPRPTMWLGRLAAVDPRAPEDETLARQLADLFTGYLRATARKAAPAFPPCRPAAS